MRRKKSLFHTLIIGKEVFFVLLFEEDHIDKLILVELKEFSNVLLLMISNLI